MEEIIALKYLEKIYGYRIKPLEIHFIGRNGAGDEVIKDRAFIIYCINRGGPQLLHCIKPISY